MIDVHILDYDNGHPKYQQWFDQAVKSVEVEPVCLHVLPGGQPFLPRRLAGYRLGSQPYVCYVDSDDYVLPGSFQVINEYLARTNVPSLFTNSWIIDADGNRTRTLYDERLTEWSDYQHSQHLGMIHQLAIIRRDVFDLAVSRIPSQFLNESCKRIEWMIFQEVAMIATWTYLPMCTYAWRIHTHNHHKRNVTTEQDIERYYQQRWLQYRNSQK